MSNIIGRSYKAPAGYNGGVDPTRLIYDKLYIGFVKDNKDAMRMGRLRVWIPELSGDPKDENKWFTIRYMSPFAGATPIGAFKDAKTSDKTQQTYGWWGIIPDLENEVAIAFASGDPGRGVLMGCLYQEYMNHMVPGIPSGPSHQMDNTNGVQPPVMEYNKWSNDSQSTDPARPRFEPLHRGLMAEGLYTDPLRGPSQSGARNVDKDLTPARAYGFLSPKGNQWYINEEENDEYIRIRTKGGAQVLVNETLGFIYINSKNGNSWVEISDQGIDVYSRHSISMRAQRDINIRADQDVNIEGGSSINLHTMSGPIRLNAEGGNIDGNTDRSLTLKAAASGTVSVGSSLSTSSGSTTSITSGSSMDLSAGGVLTQKGAIILQNSGGGGGGMSLGGLSGGLSGMVPGLSSVGSSLGGMAGGLTSQVGNLGGVASGITGSVSGLSGQIGGLSSVLGALSTVSESVTGQVGSLSTVAGDLAAQAGSLSDVSGGLANLTSVSGLDGISAAIPDLSAVQSQVADVASSVTAQIPDISSVAGSLTDQVSGVGGIDAIKGGLETQVGNLSAAAGQIQGQVGSLSDVSSTLSQAQNAVSSHIPNLEGASSCFGDINSQLGSSVPNVTDFTARLQSTPDINLGSVVDTMQSGSAQLAAAAGGLNLSTMNVSQSGVDLLNIENRLANNISTFNGSTLGLSTEANNLQGKATSLDTIKSQLERNSASLATNSADLTSAKTQLDGTIASLTQINQTAQNADLTGHITNLQTVSNNIGANASQLSTEASTIMTSANTLTEQADALTTASSSVTASATAITDKVANLAQSKQQISNTGRLLNDVGSNLETAKVNTETLASGAEKYTKAAIDHQASLPTASGTPDTILNPPSYPQTTAKTILSRMPAHEPWPLHGKRTIGGQQGIKSTVNEGYAGSVRGTGPAGQHGDPSTNRGDPKSPVGKASPFTGDPNALGSLSSRYESKGDPGSIGWDSTGGYSYGSYQIATKTGTMDEYMKHLKANNPEQYEKLQAAGGSQAALNGDPKFKAAWKEMAANDPAFGQSQHDFIKASHYDKAADRLDGSGLDVNNRSKALQDVVWSTSVQHGAGGTQKIFDRALDGRDPSTMSDEEIIKAVYAERSKTDVYFKSSTPAVKSSVANRFSREEQDALAMLRNDTAYASIQTGTKPT